MTLNNQREMQTILLYSAWLLSSCIVMVVSRKSKGCVLSQSNDGLIDDSISALLWLLVTVKAVACIDQRL